MKTKISFTSVLKNKNGSRKIDNSSQYGTESQTRSQKLIEIYQQYLSYPDKPYIIDLNAFRNMAHRSRNSSIGMLRSRNAYEDPQIDLQSWIQNQKVRQNQSQSKYIYSQKSFKMALNSQNQIMPSTKSKSNFKRLNNQPQYQYYDQQNQGINCSKGYSQKSMQESNRASSKQLRKHQLNFRSQPEQRYIQQRQMEQNETKDGLAIQSTKKSPQQLISLTAIKSRNQYPGIEEQDYSKLQQEFEKVKAQKIAQICIQGKKSLNKQKMQQIIKKTLQNIHEDIQRMAEQIVQQKRKTLTNQLNKRKISEQQSQQMLISGSRYQQKQDMSQSEQQMRQQNMRNMIKGYINGIQQAKSQGKGGYTYQDKYQQIQDENNFYQNTFNNQVFQNQPSFSNITNNNKGQINVQYSSNEPMDSVGYSFSNNNMICQHSFNKQINPHSNFQGPSNSFQKNPIQPPIYEPENQDQEEQQKISLAYIEEVRSDCGDFPHQNLQVQSSEQIEFKRKKVQNLTIDISGKNIKNIQSVHYQPPAEQISRINQNKYYRNQRNNQQLFKNFEESFPSSTLNQVKRTISPNSSSQNTSVQAPKFISKTFNSYLSGQKRVEYGQKVNAKQSYHQQEKVSDSNNSSTFQNSRKIVAINPPLSTSSAQSSIKITLITKFSPQRQIDNLQTKNSQYQEKQQNTAFATLQPTKKPSFQQSKFQSNYSKQKQNLNVLKFSKNHSNQIQKQQNNQKITSSKGLNESSMMSMNQSINNNSFAHITSPKNAHQLQSKQKFTIYYPIEKVGDQISTHNFDKNAKQSSITEFLCVSQKPIVIHNRTSSYAISSPIEEYRINQSFQQTVTIQNSHQRIESQYACSESIVQKPMVIKNSILQMQPLKLSIPNSNASQNQFGQKRTKEYVKKQNEQMIQQNNLNQNYPGVQRITQNHQDNALSYEQDKTHANSGNNRPGNMSNGLNFLQSLNTKQSIEIDLPSSSNSKIKQISEQKQSFATQTFRPSNYVSQNQGLAAKSSFSMQKSTPTNKLSVTKITLKSSFDKNPIHSPKVISLTVNHINQTKHDTVKPFTTLQPNEQKQNVFERLTIKQGVNANQVPSQKRYLLPLNYHTTSNGQSSTFNAKQHKVNLQKSIKTGFGGHNIHNHADLESKQNNNTLNQSRQNLNKQSKRNKDWRNESINFDLNLENPSNSMKQSISTTNKGSLLQKKQPLLKLSKNLDSSINQQSYNNNANFGVKKSIGQSIKFKPNQPSIMISSKMNSIKNSFKTGVKQSIGNDSDMDFDLQLD